MIYLRYISGNVGIGNNAPSQKLDLGSGNMRTTGTIYMGTWLQSINGDLKLQPASASNNIIVNQGNLGVGITNPSYNLDVNGDINFTGTLTQNGQALDLGGSVWGTGATAGEIYYNGGNVGIGINNPASKLQVGSDVSTSVIGGSTILSEIANSISVIHPTPTSSNAINDPKTTLYLGRHGTSGQSNPAGAFFRICRAINSGYSAKSRLDIDLRTRLGFVC